jgi:hypothetical protein
MQVHWQMFFISALELSGPLQAPFIASPHWSSDVQAVSAGVSPEQYPVQPEFSCENPVPSVGQNVSQLVEHVVFAEQAAMLPSDLTSMPSAGPLPGSPVQLRVPGSQPLDGATQTNPMPMMLIGLKFWMSHPALVPPALMVIADPTVEKLSGTGNAAEKMFISLPVVRVQPCETRPAVAVGVEVGSGVSVDVGSGVSVDNGLLVGVAAAVLVAVAAAVLVAVASTVLVEVATAVPVKVGSGVLVTVGEATSVLVAVAAAVFVLVAAAVLVGEAVAVAPARAVSVGVALGTSPLVEVGVAAWVLVADASAVADGVAED